MERIPAEMKVAIFEWLPPEVLMFVKLVCWEFYNCAIAINASNNMNIKYPRYYRQIYTKILSLLSSGHIECVDYIHQYLFTNHQEKSVILNSFYGKVGIFKPLYSAIQSKQVNVVKWVYHNFLQSNVNRLDNSEVLIQAIRLGRIEDDQIKILEIVIYLQKNGYGQTEPEKQDIINELALIGSVVWMKKIMEVIPVDQGEPERKSNCKEIPGSSLKYSFPCEYLRRTKKAKLNEYTFAHAALGGSLEMIEYLWSLHCDHNFWAMICAAINGHIHILEGLYRSGHRLTRKVLCAAVLGGQGEIILWLLSQGCPIGNPSHRLEGGHERSDEECKQYCLHIGKKTAFLGDPLCMAIKENYLDILKLLYEVKSEEYRLSTEHLNQAIRNFCRPGTTDLKINYDILEFLFEKNCPFDSGDYAGIVETEQQIDLLRWMLDHHYTPPEDICKWAENFTILQYLYALGYPLHKRCFKIAYKSRKREMMEWLLDKKCPL